MRRRRSDLERFWDEVYKRIENLNKRMRIVVDRELSKEAGKAIAEINRYRAKRIKEVFYESIDKFYSSYEPTVYRRKGNIKKRTGGLYDLLSIQMNEEGTNILTGSGYMGLFDESKMHTGRKGYNGLFDKVFMEGWHGGAEGGPDHPNPGKPYWRRPVPEYSQWFPRKKPAKRMKPSAYTMTVERLYEIENGDGSELYNVANEIGQKHFNVAIERIKSKIKI